MSFADRVRPVASKPGPECGTCRKISHFDDETFADYNEGIAAYRNKETNPATGRTYTRSDLARAFGIDPDNFEYHWTRHVVPSLIDAA